MPVSGDDVHEGDRLAALSDVHASAWERTIDDMHRMANQRYADGWETLTVGAGQTATEPPDRGDDDRYGLVYVIPDNKEEPFREFYEAGDYTEYDVFRAATEGRVFVVTELLDPDRQRAIYLAGNYRLRDAGPLIETVKRTGTTYTHVQLLDGTVLGSFEHDDVEKFFPRFDRFG